MKIKIYNYKFGNYANKAYRMFSTRAEWLTYMSNLSPLYQEGVSQNFNMGDGINTTLSFSTITDNLVEQANYVVVYNDDDSFHSSWFITSYQYMLGNGYTITLKRDLLSYYSQSIKKFRGLVKRGSIDPLQKTVLQFSPENISTTKIKQNEIPLQDQFGDVQWLVSYWATDMGTAEKPIEVTFNSPTPVANIEVANLNDWDLRVWITQPGGTGHKTSGDYVPYKLEYNYRTKIPTGGKRYNIGVDLQTILDNYNVTTSSDYSNTDSIPNSLFEDTYLRNIGQTKTDLMNIINTNKTAIQNAFYELLPASPGNMPPEKVAELVALNGQTIKTLNNNKIFRISVYSTKSSSASQILRFGGITRQSIESIKSAWGSFGTQFLNKVENTALNNGNGLIFTYNAQPTANAVNTANAESINFSVLDTGWTHLHFQLIDVTPSSPKTITITDLKQAGTEPYKILTIPVSDTVGLKNGTTVRPLNTAMSMALGSALAAKYSGSAGGMFDLQLIPFAPSNELLSMLVSGNLDYAFYTGAKAIAEEGTLMATAAFGVTTVDRQFSITLDNPLEVQDYKLDNILKETRLVSPSGKSVYDFSIPMNDGLDGFDVNMTLKPVISMIHINPHFKWLYGSDFDDLRGLIISEDLSMTQTGSAWENYKLQNLNFENSFNAQQEADRSKLNIVDKYADKANQLGLANSIGSGVMKTAVAAAVGGPGAAIGVGLQSAAGIVTSQIQHANDKAQRREMLTHDQDIAKRQFEMQMENIQNLPQNLSKTSGFNVLNKKFPYIELYEASTSEAEIVNSYLDLNGKNISAMGTLENYIGIRSDYDYIEFAPYTSNVFSNMALNNELNTILSDGVYLCYEDKIPGLEE